MTVAGTRQADVSRTSAPKLNEDPLVNQLGRRNLSPDAFKLALGRRYNRMKKRDGERGPQKLDQNEPASTAAKLAKEHSVSEATVKRAGNQLGRRNLSPYVRGTLALKLEVVIAGRARKQQGTRTDLPQNSAKGSPIDTLKELAGIARVSHDTVRGCSVMPS
jgi:hypothetical protein